ncbi:AAA family ATPase [Pseudarthrobacter oxydans]|jgi:Mrp family chromosome partitioning ATPase|uniref:Mrp family chromosome partitioning ATPase n=1 Tax=Pseudarthrobacter oxydans TaxID=1671 RepID=A0AAW8N5L5_PSEOX|nr:P-loop NTPase [Pseudarthrobacter oxydans]MDR6792398.1 Mrp family chromosome partitioning ATPase [Pseudarthrobacter oxydans]MDR7162129.1 Mrp family chromosome partitioning ATPase [Pseudarthrobacter oxydans]MDV2977348.1 P-loop NTPase [Actinomycetes bacterium ARC8]BFE45248.1 P-loop NTPase [Pseudarthrobacter oxydans]
MSIPVVTVGQSREDLVGGLERLHGPVTVVRRCTELPELLAACQSGLARAAVVAEGSEGLTSSLVDRLSAVGVAIVALTDNADEAARLRAIGVASAVTGVESAVLSDRIAEAVSQLSGSGPRTAPRSSPADPGEALKPVPDEPSPGPDEPGPGRIIAVWGPAGAPGRTTLAANMAGELAADGKRVILVDADSYGASIAAVLGLLDESAGLAQACRLADQGLLDRQALEKIAAPVATKSGTFRVLTGITRADRWTELRASALALVLDRARDIADVVVVDAGFCLEADEEISFDTMAPRRNAATLRSLELADTVYAVGAADPVGVPRLVRGLAELEEAVPGVSPIVVLNRVRASAVGRGPERQLRDAWERYGPASALKGFLPHDAAAADAALLGGSLLLEAAPDSPLRHAIRELVCAPAQQKRKSSVFSSTARRRVKD